MEAGGRLLGVLLGTAVLAAACASPPARPPKETQTQSQEAQPQSGSQAAGSRGTQAEPAGGTSGTAGSSSTTSAAGSYVPTEEQYLKTFAAVQAVIAELTKIIAAGDYDGWKKYLTQEYIDSRSSPGFLAAASSAPVLKKNGIQLKDLRDYFDNVVVRSRVQVTLDDIQFLDETHVKAIGLVQGTPVILYFLVNEGGRWKVGTGGSGDG